MTEPAYAFEDFRPGDVAEYGDWTVERDDMVAFAREFDPQPMHVSEEAARGSMLGELIASGWYTAALLMRINCDAFLLDAASLGSIGCDSLEWRAPVKAGDRLSVRRTVVSTRGMPGRPEAGLVKFDFEVLNAHGVVVMRQVNTKLLGRRRSVA